MSDWNPPLEGGCRCGRVRLLVSSPPLLTAACHCTGCQRMASSAFSLSAAIPMEGFAVTQGETVIGGLHGEAEHRFCAHCMSWMFTRMAGMPFVNLRPTMLDEVPAAAPFLETCTSEALPWAVIGARHSHENFPEAHEYEALIAEYRAGV